MSYCLNPVCRKPENPDHVGRCQICGLPLLLKERYRAIKPIGQGGFGKTFLAVDEDMPSKPQCVIKQFFCQGRQKDLDKAEELFRQEAVQLEKLGKNHEQIPELLAHFELGSGLYLVQEFIDGQNLLEELKQEGAFDEAKIRQLLNDLLPVLQFIHSQRIIHRDIKPENIIRCQQHGKLVLVDFGVSKFVTETSLGSTGTMIGSPGYAAPEQSEGKAYFSSDLYGLGTTCFHLLTKTHPKKVFSRYGNWEKYLRNHLNKSNISDVLNRVLTKLLQPDISQRYQSAEETLQALAISQIETTSNSSILFLLLNNNIQLLPFKNIIDSTAFISFYKFVIAKVLINDKLHHLGMIYLLIEKPKTDKYPLIFDYNLKEAYVTNLTLQTEDYKKALLAISSKMPDSYKRMLVAHYHAPSRIITAHQLAEAARYKSFEGANLQYGKLGKLMAEYCNYTPPSHTGKDSPFWSIILANGYQDEENKWYWALRPQVAEALEELGWV